MVLEEGAVDVAAVLVVHDLDVAVERSAGGVNVDLFPDHCGKANGTVKNGLSTLES